MNTSVSSVIFLNVDTFFSFFPCIAGLHFKGTSFRQVPAYVHATHMCLMCVCVYIYNIRYLNGEKALSEEWF